MTLLHNDEPTLFDLMAWDPLVKRVGDAVATCTPPHVFGVHGDWGAGKTSFLHMLHYYLAEECPQQGGPLDPVMTKAMKAKWSPWARQAHVVVVWFEAWRYQHEQAPVVALLHEIRTQLSWQKQAWNATRKTFNVAIRGFLLSIEDVTKKIGFQASKVQAAGEQWEQEHLAAALPSHTIRNFLQEAIGGLLPKKKGPNGTGPRLVVLIDDLDRCESEMAFRLLEGIKIYLNLPNCVFVLGMNQAVIESSLAQYIAKEQRKDQPENIHQLRAREYLEKLCKDIWYIPFRPAYMGDLVGKWIEGGTSDVAFRTAIVQVIRSYQCLPANPRKIKAFANTVLRMVDRLGGDAGKNRQRTAQLLVVLAGLYQFHPDLYRQVAWNPRFYEKIDSWVRGTAAAPPAHPVFVGLERAHALATVTDLARPQDQPPAVSLQDQFPDPALGNVLRLDRLMYDLGSTEPVKTEEIERFLLR
jgi:hypothetical protein